MKQRQHNVWTDSDIEWLKINYKSNVIECATKLNKPRSNVAYMVQKLGLTKKIYRKVSPEENISIEKYLKENYSNLGSTLCAKHLNLTRPAVEARAKKLKLTVDKKGRIARSRKGLLMRNGGIKVPLSNFYPIKDYRVAYILGLIYADGTLSTWRVGISASKSDLDAVITVFMATGDWSTRLTNMTERSRKQLLTISAYNVDLVNFLTEYGYRVKGTQSQEKILSIIPKNLHYMFWRGFFDGDAHCGKSGFSVSSSVDQDWSSMIHLFELLGVVKYAIYKRSHHNSLNINSKSSTITVQNMKDIRKIYDYVYPENSPKIGFPRKHDQYASKLAISPNKNISFLSDDKKEILLRGFNKWEDTTTISKYINPN